MVHHLQNPEPLSQLFSQPPEPPAIGWFRFFPGFSTILHLEGKLIKLRKIPGSKLLQHHYRKPQITSQISQPPSGLKKSATPSNFFPPKILFAQHTHKKKKRDQEPSPQTKIVSWILKLGWEKSLSPAKATKGQVCEHPYRQNSPPLRNRTWPWRGYRGEPIGFFGGKETCLFQQQKMGEKMGYPPGKNNISPKNGILKMIFRTSQGGIC